jgi:hypothetical protein
MGQMTYGAIDWIFYGFAVLSVAIAASVVAAILWW